MALAPSSSTLSDWHNKRFSFGTVSFAEGGGANGIDGDDGIVSRKYVRVPWDANEEDVFWFITEVWQLPQPVVIISLLTGRDTDAEWQSKRVMAAFKNAIKTAAMSTDVWLITHGLSYGATKIIGKVYKEEVELRAAKGARIRSKREPKLPLVLIGISTTSVIKNSEKFVGSHVDYRMSSSIDSAARAATATRTSALDPNHTHYIIIDDSDMRPATQVSLRTRIEYKMTEYRRTSPRPFITSPPSVESEEEKHQGFIEETMTDPAPEQEDFIPIICLLIGGGQVSVKTVNEHFRIKIPLVICKSSGFLADTIALTADLISSNDGVDDRFIRKTLRPDLVKKLLGRGFVPPVDNEVSAIINIAKAYLLHEKAERMVSIVDAREWDVNVHLLHRELLQVLIHYHGGRETDHHHAKTGTTGTTTRAKVREMCRRIQLFLDWNEPELAKSEIFERDDMPKHHLPTSFFEQAVVRRDREQFVDLFLDQGFSIQKYFTRKRIRRLIILNAPDFFEEVCIKGILGHEENVSDLIRPGTIITQLINEIIKKLTDFEGTFQPVEYMAQIDETSCIRILASEKQAFTSMTVLSVLLNRHSLAKIFLRRSSSPIPLSMFCSYLYKRLKHYCHIWHLRNQLKEQRKEMADFAVGILDLCYQHAESAFCGKLHFLFLISTLLNLGKHILECSHFEFEHLTTLEIAFKADLMDFMAHPFCQRYITSEYYGGIQFRKLQSGLFELPEWIKALLCAYLIFPSHWWIAFNDSDCLDESNFSTHHKMRRNVSGERLSAIPVATKSSEPINGAAAALEQSDYQSHNQFIAEILNQRTNFTCSFHEYLTSAKRIWSSPTIKFNIQYFHYILFLTLLAFCTIMPACGNFLMDTFAFYWFLTITLEQVLTLLNTYTRSEHFPLRWAVVDCLMQLLLLLLFLFLRLSPWSVIDRSTIRPMAGRITVCLAFLYLSYRVPFVYMGISRTLGPQIVWIKYTITHDFADFVKLAMVAIFGGAVTINTLIYPYWPNNPKIYQNAFLRAFFAFFLTEKVDIETAGTGACASNLLGGPNSRQYCLRQMQDVSHSLTSDPWLPSDKNISYTCAYHSSFGWIVLVQYFILVKLFLWTILYAMFNNSYMSISEYSSQVWMFKRYENLMELKNSTVLPPPLNVFYYLYLMCAWGFIGSSLFGRGIGLGFPPPPLLLTS